MLNSGAGFKENYGKLLKELRKKGIEVSQLEKKLPEFFWDIRHRVIHGGYTPSVKELDIIITYIERVLKILMLLTP